MISMWTLIEWSVGLLHLPIDVDPRDRGIKDLINAGRYRPSSDDKSVDPMASDVWPREPPDKHLSLPGRAGSPIPVQMRLKGK
ncbi:hypothetical protein BC827DRAFT_1192364 [Russula dissimulans]|nr:hypothetical protein BC827DRAFT_1192364 [Russula dissimulans]